MGHFVNSMNKKDISIGLEVYHTMFPHMGKGIVKQLRQKDFLGFPTSQKVRVEWHKLDGGVIEQWCRLSQLRKTFNQKKMDMLVDLAGPDYGKGKDGDTR